MGWTEHRRSGGQKGGVAGTEAHTGAGDGTGFLWQVFKGSLPKEEGLRSKKEELEVRRDFRRQQRLGRVSVARPYLAK